MITASVPQGTADTLFGRSAEIALIQSALEQRADAPRSILFCGDPGIGKTALVQYAAAAAQARGMRVITVWNNEAQFLSELPYSTLNLLVAPLLPWSKALSVRQRDALDVALGAAPAEPVDRLALFSAVSELASAASADQPLLICVEDVHWSDHASDEAIRFLTHRLGRGTITIVSTTRAPLDGRFGEVEGTIVVPLDPLDGEAADALLRSRFPSLGTGARARLAQDAQGNPLALLELPPVWERRTPLEYAETYTPLPLSRRLVEIYAERVRRLPESTRRLLLLAALEGTGALGTLRDAFGEASLSALVAAEDAGVVNLVEAGGRLEFRHPLTRSAVVEDSTPSEQREAHARLAAALAGDIVRQAHHLAAATVEPDDHVAGLLDAAAQHAQHRGDLMTATRLLTRAGDLSPDADSRRRRMAEAAFVVARRPGSGAQVSGLLNGLASPDPGSDEALYAIAAGAFLSLERGADLVPVFAVVEGAIDAAAEVGNTGSAAFAAVVETMYAICALACRPAWSSRFERARDLLPDGRLKAGLQAATAMLDPARTFSTLIPIVEHSVAAEGGMAGPELVAVASSALYLDRLRACRTALEGNLLSARGSDDGGDIRVNHLLWIEAFQSGRWADAAGLARGGIEIGHAIGATIWVELFACMEAVLAAVRGDSNAAVSAADSVLLRTAGRGYGAIRAAALYALTLEAFGRRDWGATFAFATQIGSPGVLPRDLPLALWVFYELVSSAARLGRTEDASRHLRTLRELGVEQISPRYGVLVAACEAMLSDRAAASAQMLSDAIAVADLDAWPFDRARMQLLLAEFLIAANRHDEAQAYAGSASQLLRFLGARPWEDQAAELIAVGGGVPTDGLTPTERKVVRLAASGLTNKEIGARLFLSDRTVATHLYRSFPKLGITRRAALRDAIARIEHER